jgi:pentatricopeptide repeat protein
MYKKLSSRFELESRTHTVMIAGCIAAGKFDYADIVCQNTKHQDIELLNVIMKLYCYSNRFSLAMNLFKQNSHNATASTYSIMIAGCNANSAWSDMDNIVKHMEDTAFTVQGRVATALIAAYFKRNQPERAYDLYYHMRAKNTHIDLATYTQLLSHVSSPSFNFALEEEILHEENPTVTQKHILILCYARRDDHESAMKVFESMEKNVENLSVILQAHSLCGKGVEAVEALNDIIRLGVSPSSDAYVSALSACSRSAMMEEGEKIFETLNPSS